MPGILRWTVADHRTRSIEHAVVDNIPKRDKLRVPISRQYLQLILKTLLPGEKCLHSRFLRTRPVAKRRQLDDSLIL
jgi:hypothetical protein